MKKISPQRYIQGFFIIVICLALARELTPSLAFSTKEQLKTMNEKFNIKPYKKQSPLEKTTCQNSEQNTSGASADFLEFKPHKIYSVSSFENCFPDQNDIQLVAAQKNGVKPVKDRAEAEKRKDELVYVGSNPYFFIDKAKTSIPYLVPSASVLLQDIGRVFFDSLQVKGIPLHKIIVTSVLRTQYDVAKLTKRNANAKQNSCHQYATTFDICYNRYKNIEDPEGPERRMVTNDTLKWVLSEVLNDIRKNERCYIKYEKKQSCYHITVR